MSGYIPDTSALFETTCFVRCHETDADGFIRPTALLHLMQDAAGEHAARLGVSVPALFRRNLTWVLSRYHVVFHRYPPVHSRIVIRTWPCEVNGRFALREFELVDGDGAPVVTASTSWLVLDLRNRRPVRIAEHLPELPLHPQRAVMADFAPLPELAQDGFCHIFRVRHADIDLNRHVNNVVYVEWGIETLPPATIGSVRPARLEVAYRAETRYGDRVVSCSETVGEEPLTTLHRLAAESDGRELTRLRIVWQPVAAN